jgi:hypothetical protein
MKVKVSNELELIHSCMDKGSNEPGAKRNSVGPLNKHLVNPHKQPYGGKIAPAPQ